MEDRLGSRIVRGALAALVAAVVAASAPRVAAAEEGGGSFLAMYFDEEELHVLAATRSLRSIEHVAENVTVVTAADIRLMNAHTLADVLGTVPGFHVHATGAFGAGASGRIFASEQRHVAVLWNGVLLNTLGDALAVLNLISVADIERVEVVKGPASSAWGSALGGVVNIVTVEPGRLPFEGEVRASYGSEASGDYRATVGGRQGPLGYALAAARLETDGLTEGHDAAQDQLQAHVTFDLGAATRLRLDASHNRDDRGDGAYPASDLENRATDQHRVASLGLSSAFGGGFELDLAVSTLRFEEGYFLNVLSDGSEVFGITTDQRRSGGSAKLAWKGLTHAAVAGFDYSRERFETSGIPGEELERTLWALYANTTLDFGRFTVTPGLRHDEVGGSATVLSPSLGATCALGERTLLRATVAHGFSAPDLFSTKGNSEVFGYRANPDLGTERVWSYEAGLESDVARRLWLKLSVFRHEIDDAIVMEDVEDPPYLFTLVNGGRQRNDGLSLEWRTAPWHDLVLEGGATWVRATDLETDEPVVRIPNQEFQVALRYDDRGGTQALVQGHYYRERDSEEVPAAYRSMLVDVHLRRRIVVSRRVALELFASGHNVFDGTLAWAPELYPNVGRWFEAGASVTF